MLKRVFICCVSVILLLGSFSPVNDPLPFRKAPAVQTKPLALINFITDPLLKSDTPSCTIPFTLAGKLILVQGRADTTVGNFILDTGAPNLVLNTTYFRDYPIDQSHDESQESITGSGDLAQRTVVKHFRLGTLNYYKAEADLISLRHIENAKGVKILGLLGVSLFKECEIVIDYKQSVIHLHHINKKERKTYQHAMLKDSSAYTSYPFDLIENRILVTTKIAGKELPFVIDYAAETNIIDSRLPDKILDSVNVNGRILLTGSGSRKIEAITGDLSGFHLGEMPVDNLSVIVTNLEGTCFGKTSCIQGVLGHEFLSRYTLVFNFARRKLFVLK